MNDKNEGAAKAATRIITLREQALIDSGSFTPEQAKLAVEIQNKASGALFERRYEEAFQEGQYEGAREAGRERERYKGRPQNDAAMSSFSLAEAAHMVAGAIHRSRVGIWTSAQINQVVNGHLIVAAVMGILIGALFAKPSTVVIAGIAFALAAYVSAYFGELSERRKAWYCVCFAATVAAWLCAGYWALNR